MDNWTRPSIRLPGEENDKYFLFLYNTLTTGEAKGADGPLPDFPRSKIAEGRLTFIQKQAKVPKEDTPKPPEKAVAPPQPRVEAAPIPVQEPQQQAAASIPATPPADPLEEKLATLRTWVHTTIAREINQKVIGKRLTLQGATDLQGALEVVQSATKLKPVRSIERASDIIKELEKSKQLLSELGLTLSEMTKPTVLPEDKLQAVKMVTDIAFTDLLQHLTTIRTAVDKSNQQQLLAFVRIVKEINQLLGL